MEASHVEAYRDHVPCRCRSLLHGDGGHGACDAGGRAGERHVRFAAAGAVYEAVPAPRAGYVWAPGHYRLINDRYAWTPGHWEAARVGYRYIPDTWERTMIGGREQWRYVPSRWDRNGDGVPDRYERHSERGPYGDRDHDGIPNAYDRYDNRR